MISYVRREPAAFAEYKKYRDMLTSDLRKAKNDYYQKTFERIYNTRRKIWEAVNALTGKSTSRRYIEKLTIIGEALSGERLANAMNSHFINAGSYKASSTSTDNTSLDGAKLPYSIFMGPTDSVDIGNVISKLKINVASGIDEIRPIELK